VKEVDAPWFEKDSRQKTFRLWPHKLHGEGHFAAVLKKAGTLPRMEAQKSSVKRDAANSVGLDRAQRQILEAFVRETLSDEQCSWILNGNLTLFGDQLYRLPDGAPSLKGIRVLRAGLHIGEFKKNRFEPSHALALFFGTEDVNCYLSLPAEDARIAGFLRGESIFLHEDDILNGEKGWCLVCVDGCSLGWGKLAGNQIKNHYPKGLRKDII
jgi:NOL1/NOP2/fmu family ribosome biogenesis protein